MLSAILILAASFSALCTAQGVGVSNLPGCAQPCATPLPAECGPIDAACICKDKAWLDKIACCVQTSCSRAEQDDTIKAAQQLCSIVKVSIATTLPSTCASTATGSSSAKAASTGSMSMTGSSTDMSRTTTGSSATVAAATGSSSTGSAPATQTSNAANTLAGYGSGAAGAVAIAFALL